MWRLSDEEALKVIRTHDPTWPSLFASDKALIKATLRKVYGEGEKPCPHSTYAGHAGKNPLKRHECPECWAELKKEAGL